MIEIVVNNLDTGCHPFHLHGYVFQVEGLGNGVYNGHNNTEVIWSLTNPMRRDTICIPPEGFVLTRFRADAPGARFFHCRIAWQLESVLAATFIEAPDVAQQRFILPQSLRYICTHSGIPAVGNATGKEGLYLSGAPDSVTLFYDGFTA